MDESVTHHVRKGKEGNREGKRNGSSSRSLVIKVKFCTTRGIDLDAR